MRRADVVALAQGALVGALVAGAAVLIWTAASRPAGFPITSVSLPSDFIVPSANPNPNPTSAQAASPELPITLEADGLGISFFGDEGENVIRGLETLLGPPNADEHWTCLDPAGEVRFVQWADLGVFVIDGVFVGWVDAIHFPPEFGPLLEVKMREDLHIGVELEHFEAHLGDRFALREPAPDAAEGAAREFEIDGADGIHGLVEDGADGSRVVVPLGGHDLLRQRSLTPRSAARSRRGILRAHAADPVPPLRAP